MTQASKWIFSLPWKIAFFQSLISCNKVWFLLIICTGANRISNPVVPWPQILLESQVNRMVYRGLFRTGSTGSANPWIFRNSYVFPRVIIRLAKSKPRNFFFSIPKKCPQQMSQFVSVYCCFNRKLTQAETFVVANFLAYWKKILWFWLS